jgi:hypothetical protein
MAASPFQRLLHGFNPNVDLKTILPAVQAGRNKATKETA